MAAEKPQNSAVRRRSRQEHNKMCKCVSHDMTSLQQKNESK